MLAERCVRTGASPQMLAGSARGVSDVQRVLADELGVTLQWPEHVRIGSPVQDHVATEETLLAR